MRAFGSSLAMVTVDSVGTFGLKLRRPRRPQRPNAGEEPLRDKSTNRFDVDSSSVVCGDEKNAGKLKEQIGWPPNWKLPMKEGQHPKLKIR